MINGEMAIVDVVVLEQAFSLTGSGVAVTMHFMRMHTYNLFMNKSVIDR